MDDKTKKALFDISPLNFVAQGFAAVFARPWHSGIRACIRAIVAVAGEVEELGVPCDLITV